MAREYWTNPLFRRTNEIITAYWGVCFSICVGLDVANRLWPSHDLILSAILPNVVTVAAILFSVRFPTWYSLREMAKRIAEQDPYTWPMPRFGSPYQDDEYDIVVIGAGIGGLTAASLLAQRGLRVIVLEQHFRPGGYCSSWRRATAAGKFLFDAGVHDVSGLGPKGPVRNLMKQLGIEGRLRWLRVGQAYVIDGENLKVPHDPQRFAAMLGELFPADKEGIAQLFREVETVYREMYVDIETTGGVPCPPRTPQERLAYPRSHPAMVRWMDKPFSDLVDAFVQDEAPKRALFALCGYLTDRPGSLSVREMAPVFGYYFDGGHYPQGGSQAFARALAESLSDSGGELLLRTGVRAIGVKDGQAVGVETTSGAFIKARVVLSNADVRRTFMTLLDKSDVPEDFLSKIEEVTPSPSAFAVFLGLDFVPDLEPVTIVTDSCAIAIPSKVDPDLAPEGHASVTLLRLIRTEESALWNRESTDYADQKKRMGDDLIDRAEKVIPGLRQHIVFREEASPATFGRYNWSSDGAIYGSARGQWTPPARTPIQGLMLAGAGVFPGSGIEAVVISGTLAADTIYPKPTRRETRGESR